MENHTSCPSCGWEGAPEEVTRGFSVCGGCGRPLGASSESLFEARRFRLRRALGRGVPRTLEGDDGRELALVRRARLGPRQLLAYLAGALTTAALMMALLMLPEVWPAVGWWPAYVLGPFALTLGLRVSARVSPGPSLLLVKSGRDPRLLLQIRPVAERGARCTLEVEDTNGSTIGELELDRTRAKPSALGGLEGYLQVKTPDGVLLAARRLSRLRPGAVLETRDGDAVATVGLSGGMSWDELQIGDDSNVDPRLLVAAALVASP